MASTPAILSNGLKLAHLNIYPSRQGATGVCKSIRHWCFCVILENGRRHTDQGHTSKKAALAYIERFAPDWAKAS
jgi:hypothetical protein